MQKVEVRELREDDLAAAVAFLHRQQALGDAADGLPAFSEERLRWFAFDNPARDRDLPLGWTLRGPDAAVVGLMLCVPQWFQRGEQRFRLLLSGSYYVDERFRGQGLALFQRYRALGRSHALYCTTANAMSGQVWSRFGGQPLAGSDREWLGALRWGPLVEEVVRRRSGSAGLGRLAGGLAGVVPGTRSLRAAPEPARGSLARLDSLDGVAELDVLGRAEHADRITALRDDAFLRWRYFGGPDRTCALYRFDGADGARCLAGVNVQTRGQRGQIRALTLLDVWGHMPGASIAALAACLADAYRDRADLIVFRGQPPEREAALRDAGLLCRALPVAIGWCIDRASLLPASDWYLVPADGDMAA